MDCLLILTRMSGYQSESMSRILSINPKSLLKLSAWLRKLLQYLITPLFCYRVLSTLHIAIAAPALIRYVLTHNQESTFHGSIVYIVTLASVPTWLIDINYDYNYLRFIVREK